MLSKTRCRPHIARLLNLYFLLLVGVVVRLWWRELPVHDYEGSGPHSTNKATGNQDLLSPGPYPYIINEANKCPEGKAQPFLVLLIATVAREVEARDAIRQTWGNESLAPGLGFIRLFLLGASDGKLGRLHQRTLESESQRHHDIIQQDFLDTYNNLTLKVLMGINWVAMHCPRASYVMKTDSDMFVNTDYLIHKLLRPKLTPKKNYYTGFILYNSIPVRDKNNKWYISLEEYPGVQYPNYCSGSGYVFSGELAVKIYQTSLSIPHLHFEDVYVGVCLLKVRIQPTFPPNEFWFNNEAVPYSSCKYSNLITAHRIQPSELLKYWHEVQISTCINA